MTTIGLCRIRAALAAIVVLSLASGRSAAAPELMRDPATPGIYEVHRENIPSKERYEVYCPNVVGRRPWAVIARNVRDSNQTEQNDPSSLATHLASWGFVVLVADAGNRETIEQFYATHGERQDPDAALHGCEVTAAVGWVGQDREAYAALSGATMFAELATRVTPRAAVAIEPPRLAAVDPSDESQPRETRIERDKIHVLILAAEVTQCNGEPDLSTVERRDQGRATFARVAKTNHCDALGPDDPTCASRCKLPDVPPHNDVFLRLTTGWLLAYVADVPSALNWLPPARAYGLVDVMSPRFPSYFPFDRIWSPSIVLGTSVEVKRKGNSAFTGGARVAMLFAKTTKSAFGAGPYAEALITAGDPVVGAGATLFVGREGFVAPAVGAYARNFEQWEPGLTAGAVLGFKIEGSPLLSLGGRVDGRFGLGPTRERAITIAADLSPLLPLLPFLAGAIGD